jgi:hypothetical protein
MQLDIRGTALRAPDTAGFTAIQASKYGLRGDLRSGAGWPPLVLLKTAMGLHPSRVRIPCPPLAKQLRTAPPERGLTAHWGGGELLRCRVQGSAGVILVTGATGQVGYRLLERLDDLRSDVTAMVRVEAKAADLPPKVQHLVGIFDDPPDRETLRNLDRIFLLSPATEAQVELEVRSSSGGQRRTHPLDRQARGRRVSGTRLPSQIHA